MGTERILTIAAGTAAMLGLMLFQRKRYPSVAVWKLPVISVILTVCGVLGTMLLFFLEIGRFGGTSFFGAVLLVPLLMLPALLLRISYGTLMDLCAAAECAMLAIMKIDCLRSGCCQGVMMENLGFRFPSQIVEMIAALAIMVILVVLGKQQKNRGKLYPLYLMFYGGSRFILNWFREDIAPYFWQLPPGNYWALISVGIGFAWLIFLRRKERVA